MKYNLGTFWRYNEKRRKNKKTKKTKNKKKNKRTYVDRVSNPAQVRGRQLCSPLHHHGLIYIFVSNSVNEEYEREAND